MSRRKRDRRRKARRLRRQGEGYREVVTTAERKIGYLDLEVAKSAARQLYEAGKAAVVHVYQCPSDGMFKLSRMRGPDTIWTFEPPLAPPPADDLVVKFFVELEPGVWLGHNTYSGQPDLTSDIDKAKSVGSASGAVNGIRWARGWAPYKKAVVVLREVPKTR